MTCPHILNHRNSITIRHCRTMTTVAIFLVTAFLAVGTTVVTTRANGSPSHASVPSSVRTLSAHMAYRPAATHSKHASRTTNLASVEAPVHPVATTRVVLYGDSLAWQAQDSFRVALAAVGITNVTTRTFGGTAICDWLPQMRADEAFLQPDAVVIEFSGNAFTPCMRDLAGRPLSGPAYFEKYSGDARTALGIFAKVDSRVYLAGSPLGRLAEQTHDFTSRHLNHLYAAIAAASRNARYINAGASVLDHGQWTDTLPCLPEEPCAGGIDRSGRLVNIVRAPDGSHFCPVAAPAVLGVTAACPVYSSGAYRYGTAMAAPVIVDFTGLREPVREAELLSARNLIHRRERGPFITRI